MIFLDYTDQFEVSFDLKNYTFTDFEEIVEEFKRYFFSYDPEEYCWVVPDLKMEEIVLYFVEENIDFIPSDSAIQALQRIKNSYFKELKFFRGKTYDESVINPGVILFDYQKEGVNWRIKRNRVMDADDAGLGKSIQNIIVFSSLYKEGRVDKILIICPGGLCFHWKEEILKFVNQFTEDDIQLIDNKNKLMPFANYKDKKILVMPNHLIATSVLSYRKGFKLKKSQKKARWNHHIPVLADLWEGHDIFLLVDESHEIKSMSAIKTKAIFSLGDQFKYKTLLSATPAINRIEDFYAQIHFLNPKMIPMTEIVFKKWIGEELGNRWDINAIVEYNDENVTTFFDSIQPLFIKRLKEDIPEMKAIKIIKELFLDTTPQQYQMYQLVCEQEIAFLEEEYEEVGWKQINNTLPMICNILDNPLILKKRYYDNEKFNKLISKWKIEDDPKFILLKSLIEKYVDYLGEKVIVYDIHPETLDLLAEKFSKYKPLVIHGGLKVKDIREDRKRKQDLFNNSDENKIIFLSALTSSAGLNLQKKCNRIIVYAMPWDGTHWRQLQDRTHRIVSEKDSIIEVLNYSKTLDNYRISKAFNRASLNDKIGKPIVRADLKNLLRGIL